MADVTEINRRRSIQGYVIGANLQPLPDAEIQSGHLAQVLWLYGLDYPGSVYVPPSDRPSPYRPVLRVRRR